MSFSNTMENAILDHVYGGGDYTRAATLYIALYTVTPSDAGGGTEVTGGSYARYSATNNATNFPAASGGSKSNGVEFAFATASASWGTIVAFGVLTASSGGTLISWGPISPNKLIDSGDTARFAAGTLVFTLD